MEPAWLPTLVLAATFAPTFAATFVATFVAKLSRLLTRDWLILPPDVVAEVSGRNKRQRSRQRLR